LKVVAGPVATLGVEPSRGTSVELEDVREVVVTGVVVTGVVATGVMVTGVMVTGVAVPRVSEFADDQEVEAITIGAVGWRACGTDAMLVSPKPGRALTRVPGPPSRAGAVAAGSAGTYGRPHRTHVRKRGSRQRNQMSKRGNEAFISRGPARVRNEWR
jgi:hypothetical protein